jgi:hypothetical protein
LPIVEIEWMSAIFDLNAVIGKHAVLGLCLAAPAAMVYGLASTTSTGYYLGAPSSILGASIDRISELRWWCDAAGVDGPHQWGKST